MTPRDIIALDLICAPNAPLAVFRRVPTSWDLEAEAHARTSANVLCLEVANLSLRDVRLGSGLFCGIQ